jgi:transcriptional regulator with XRE-family HTH domain
MEFWAYRQQTGMPQRAAAEWFGVSMRQLARWEQGEQIPRPEMQRKIQQLTAGLVTPADWIDGHERRRRQG